MGYSKYITIWTRSKLVQVSLATSIPNKLFLTCRPALAIAQHPRTVIYTIRATCTVDNRPNHFGKIQSFNAANLESWQTRGSLRKTPPPPSRFLKRATHDDRENGSPALVFDKAGDETAAKFGDMCFVRVEKWRGYYRAGESTDTAPKTVLPYTRGRTACKLLTCLWDPVTAVERPKSILHRLK